jgi:hypothetical protein
VLVGDARVGSVTLATLAGVASIAACAIAPLRGRLLDRQDLRRAVQIECLLMAANLSCWSPPCRPSNCIARTSWSR